MTKLEALNSLKVIVGVDADGDELNSVTVEATEENIDTLLDAGFSMKEIELTTDTEGETIDIAVLAFDYAGATTWSKESGFENGFAEIEPRKCRVCGCIDYDACPGGCYWVEEDLCNRCVGEESRTEHKKAAP